MIELSGKFNIAKVFTDNIDNSTIGQIISLLNQRSISNSSVRIMPDCHAGAGCVIGTTMTIKDKVIPNLVGVDIGCGMLAIKLKEKRVNLPEFDSIVRNNVVEINDSKISTRCNDIENLRCYKNHAPIRVMYAYASIGTLGGGNHFIELDKDSEDNIWLVIHTGSRHLGVEVANWYQKKAYEDLKLKANNGSKASKRQDLVDLLKSEGRQKEISSALKKFDNEYKDIEPDVPYSLAYCEGDLFEDYIHDMKIVQEYASCNRAEIARRLLKKAGLHEESRFETIHNYIDTDNMILRKGSISAQENEMVLIPINMRDGSLVCIGKGNPDWNFSAPHGAGRIYSRSEAKSKISVSEFKKTMSDAGIFSTSVGSSTIDEAPMAYKPMDEIVENIKDTVEIIDIIKPIYNFKSGSEELLK